MVTALEVVGEFFRTLCGLAIDVACYEQRFVEMVHDGPPARYVVFSRENGELFDRFVATGERVVLDRTWLVQPIESVALRTMRVVDWSTQ